MFVNMPASSHLCVLPFKLIIYSSDVTSCSKLNSSILFFRRSWYVLFWAFSPSLDEIVGPNGTISFWSIKFCLSLGITFTIISSSFTQLMTSPMLEFSFRSESFISDLDSRFKTHNLTPSDDVFVKAMFFWLGDQFILAIWGLGGIPTISLISEFLLFRFLILILL